MFYYFRSPAELRMTGMGQHNPDCKDHKPTLLSRSNTISDISREDEITITEDYCDGEKGDILTLTFLSNNKSSEE